MANLWQPSINRALDSDGNPASGALLSIYRTDSVIPETFFLDEEGAVVGSNPLVANSNGILPAVYLDQELVYRMVLTDSLGSEVIYDVDPVRGFDESAAATSSAIAVAASITAVDAAQQASTDATEVSNNLDQITDFTDRAEDAATRSEDAANVSSTNSNVFVDEATGRAAVLDGETFLIESGDGYADLYRRINATTSTYIDTIANRSNFEVLSEIAAAAASSVNEIENMFISTTALAVSNLAKSQENCQRLDFLEAGLQREDVWVDEAQINPEGWTIDISMDVARAGGTFDYSKIFVTVYDDGFIGDTAVVTPRQIGVSRIKLKDYPQHEVDEIETVGGQVTFEIALHEQVYTTSGQKPKLSLQYGYYRDSSLATAPTQILEGIANNSTEAYVVPFGQNFTAPLRYIGAIGTFEFMGRGIGGRDGRGLSAAVCTITGLTSGHSVRTVVTKITESDFYPRRTVALPVYAAKVDMSGFTQGEDLREDWEIFPFIGDTSYSTVDGVRNNGDAISLFHTCDKDGTFPRVYVYVDPTNGDNGTGVASDTPATASASPFANEAQALFTAQEFNNTNNSNNTLSGVHVRFVRGQDHSLTMLRSSSSAPEIRFTAEDANISNGWCVYEPDPDGTGDCRLVSNTSSSDECYPRGTEFRGFTAIHVTDTQRALDGRSDNALDGAFKQKTRFVDTTFTDSGAASNGTIFLHRTGDTYFENIFSSAESNNFTDGFSNTDFNLRLVRNSDFSVVESLAPFAMGGTLLQNIEGTLSYGNTALVNRVPVKSPVISGLRIERSGGNQVAILYDGLRAISGVYLLNVLVESANSTQGLLLTANDNFNANNHWYDHVSTFGERWNSMYEDTFTMTGEGQLKKNSGWVNCLLWERDYKDGAFDMLSGRIHTTNQGYHVGSRYVRYLVPCSNGDTEPNFVGWYGRAWPTGFEYVGADSQGLFVNYTANSFFPTNGAGSTGGDYQPLATATQLHGVPAYSFTCPIDLYGAVRKIDGTAAFGAIERQN